jgi:L-asparaginase
MKPRVLLISTGGTITMTGASGSGIAPTLTGEDLVRAVPALDAIADIDVVAYSTKPGASLTFEDLIDIAGVCDAKLGGDCAGAVIVQGTDTIEETSFALDLLVDSSSPVIVTGAMRGPQAPGADGPANLLAAVMVAASPDARDLGTLVVLNDEVHAARYVRKSDTALPSAFTSPGGGPLGRVSEGVLRIHARVARTAALPRPGDTRNCPVAIVKIILGDDARLLRSIPELGFAGVVIEAMGAGHVPAMLAPVIGELARRMPVVLATRVAAGPVFTHTYGFEGSEKDLLTRGVIPAGSLASVKAAVLLRLLLAQSLAGQDLRAAFTLRSST